MTPLLVGVTTGYLANRRSLLSGRRTALVVLLAAALGTLALVMFALEGNALSQWGCWSRAFVEPALHLRHQK